MAILSRHLKNAYFLSELVFIFNLIKPRVTWEEGISTERLSRSDWPVAISVGNCLDCYERTQPIAGNTIFWTGVLVLYKKAS